MVAVALGVGCASSEPQPIVNFGRKPPPKPGSSITHSVMCSCTVCEPTSCCEGPGDAPDESTCGDSHDFTQSENCGIAIRSCAGRCGPKRWRVAKTEACEARMPKECCSGHPLERDG